MVVAITFGRARRWDCFEKPVDPLIGHVRLPIEYQNRYDDFPEGFRRPIRRDRTANDGRKNLRD